MRTHEYPGLTGLGLTMIDRLIKSESGRLQIDSAPGEGTRIRLSLPGVDRQPSGEAPARAHRVMVVEDHSLLRPMRSEVLIKAGCVVKAYGEGVVALDEIVDSQPDLLVVDVNLPGQCGDELAAELRTKCGRDIPVLFITGDRDFALPEWPAVDLILKTFELVVFTRKALESSFDWGPRSGEELQPLPGQIAHRLLDQFETRSLELES